MSCPHQVGIKADLDTRGVKKRRGRNMKPKKSIVPLVIFLVLLAVLDIPPFTGLAESLGRQASIFSALIGGQSQVIVPESDVEVSKTAIAFSVLNNADECFCNDFYIDLARNVGGLWLFVPREYSVGFFFHCRPMASGETSERFIEFESWLGALPPGRYMFIERFVPHERHRERGNREFLMIEFVIDENTPLYFVEWVDIFPNDLGWSRPPFRHPESN